MMTASRVKALITFALMATAFGAATAWRPSTHLADQRPKVTLETLIPRSFGEWVIDDRQPVQMVSPDQQAVLSKLYNDTLSRTYVNRKTGQRIMLSVAYGGDQSDATRAHRPEVCYPAQGFQIMDNHSDVFATGTNSIPVQRLFAKMGGRMEPITYWVVVGEKVALTGTQQKLAQLNYSMRGIIPDGTLVRVSNIDSDPLKSYTLHDEFLREMALAIPEELRPRLVGKPHG